MPPEPNIWKLLLGGMAILLFFLLIGWLLMRAKRTHSRRIGGIHWRELYYGRFLRLIPSRRRQRK